MSSKQILLLIIVSLLSFSCFRKNNTSYPIEPVGFTEVSTVDSFWSSRIKTNREVTIPYTFQKCEETGRIDNFRIAAGVKSGAFQTIRGFDDSDVYKVMEGAAYSLADHPDKLLEKYLDSLIFYVGEAQEEDGYLYTLRTIMGDSSKTGNRYDKDVSQPRWMGIESGTHELYNVGHMYEAAVAHYYCTHKRTFLNIAIKNADLICRTFGYGKLEIFPGHQEIELALVKLYNATGDSKYLDMAKFFLDIRGKTQTRTSYNQSHKPVIEQNEAVGHAVRALYMFAGMADIAAITGNKNYLSAMDKLWHNIVDYQLYITGGVGAPGGNEGFAGRYDLSNHNAYCETCAAIANVMWNYRMFLTYGEAKYMDLVERSLYNNILSGVSLEGNTFFYPNRLESRGNEKRSEWFNCSCCPTNITRFIPSVPGYIYAKTRKEIYVNLFISSNTKLLFGEKEVQLKQESGIPWNGNLKLKLNSSEKNHLQLKVRIPGWASENPVPSDLYTFSSKTKKRIQVKLNGNNYPFTENKGYLVLERDWEGLSNIEISFPYEIRKIIAHDSVISNRGKVALQAGPLVYCTEWPDQQDGKVLDKIIDTSSLVIKNQSLFQGINNYIEGNAISQKLNKDLSISKKSVILKAIPYYAWAHRGSGEMAVWIALNENSSIPVHYSTLASESKIEASQNRFGITGINDHRMPDHSGSREETNFNFWPQRDTTSWISYTFENPQTVRLCSVYWFSDIKRGGGCDLPQSWRILYKKDGEWIPVHNTSAYETTRDELCTVNFSPVITTGVRMEITMKDKSAGLYEWIVK